MTPAALISTERLLLQGLTPALIHEMFRTKTKEQIMALLGTDEAGYAHYREMHETGRPLGEAGFHTWNATHRRAELFYLLRKDDYKRQGFMKEALPAIIQYGFEQLNLHRIEALVAPDNTPSIRLLHRFGFTKEGTMREDYVVNGINEDSDCYSLLRHEWLHPANAQKQS